MIFEASLAIDLVPGLAITAHVVAHVATRR
jgi:hypothetical protein